MFQKTSEMWNAFPLRLPMHILEIWGVGTSLATNYRWGRAFPCILRHFHHCLYITGVGDEMMDRPWLCCHTEWTSWWRGDTVSGPCTLPRHLPGSCSSPPRLALPSPWMEWVSPPVLQSLECAAPCTVSVRPSTAAQHATQYTCNIQNRFCLLCFNYCLFTVIYANSNKLTIT